MKIVMKILSSPYAAWMRFVRALGWVNSKIILSVTYFTILGLYAICYRIYRAFVSSQGEAGWTPKKPNTDPAQSIRRQF